MSVAARLTTILALVYASCHALGAESPTTGDLNADLLIVGGTESGCAAAVQAARMGVRRIVLVNDVDWLGGQFSAEALVAIDENRGPEGYGHGLPFPRSGLFKEVMDRIERRNLARYGRRRPGNTRVLTTCRPKDAAAAFDALVEPYVSRGQLRIVERCYPIQVHHSPDGDAVIGVRFARATSKAEFVVHARLTIDASDWGDVIRLSNAGYEFGPDLKGKYGEPLAPVSREDYPITDMNPITYCMVIEETEREGVIPKPSHYDPRNYRQHAYPKDPEFIYTSRRISDRYAYPEITLPDAILLCFPAFDYPLDVLPQRVVDAIETIEPGSSGKNIFEMTRDARDVIFDDAKQYSLGFLHYLQTEGPNTKSKRYDLRRFQLSEEFGTPDRMPPKPYVRESLRLEAMYMMRQQDTTGVGGDARNYASKMYHDGVACWQFEYDFHPTRRRFLTDDRSGPWHTAFREGRRWGPPYSGRSLFPLRSLIPLQTNGLLGAQKNLGYSSIVSSAVRLHDQSTAIGQAAGAAAAVALEADVDVRRMPYDTALLAEVWDGLCANSGDAVPSMLWPFRDLSPDHPAFVAVNQLAARRALPLSPRDVNFRPHAVASASWREEVVRRTARSKELPIDVQAPSGPMTRGEFAHLWWLFVQDRRERPFELLSSDADDADDDGIQNEDDALPLNATNTSWPVTVHGADEIFAEHQGVRHIFGGLVFSQEQRISAEE